MSSNGIFFLATEPRVNNSAWTVQIHAPNIGPLCRYLVHTHDTFLFSCKWFILTSDKRIHNFFSYLIFFSSRMLRFTTRDSWLSYISLWKQALRQRTPNMHRDWVIVCFGRGSKLFQTWKSSELGLLSGLITCKRIQSHKRELGSLLNESRSRMRKNESNKCWAVVWECKIYPFYWMLFTFQELCMDKVFILEKTQVYLCITRKALQVNAACTLCEYWLESHVKVPKIWKHLLS